MAGVTSSFSQHRWWPFSKRPGSTGKLSRGGWRARARIIRNYLELTFCQQMRVRECGERHLRRGVIYMSYGRYAGGDYLLFGVAVARWLLNFSIVAPVMRYRKRRVINNFISSILISRRMKHYYSYILSIKCRQRCRRAISFARRITTLVELEISLKCLHQINISSVSLSRRALTHSSGWRVIAR